MADLIGLALGVEDIAARGSTCVRLRASQLQCPVVCPSSGARIERANSARVRGCGQVKKCRVLRNLLEGGIDFIRVRSILHATDDEVALCSFKVLSGYPRVYGSW